MAMQRTPEQIEEYRRWIKADSFWRKRREKRIWHLQLDRFLKCDLITHGRIVKTNPEYLLIELSGEYVFLILHQLCESFDPISRRSRYSGFHHFTAPDDDAALVKALGLLIHPPIGMAA